MRIDAGRVLMDGFFYEDGARRELAREGLFVC
jgi:hypothetical protein